MKLEQSQLDYIKTRGSNYDRKYGMFQSLLDKLPNTIPTVVELFGGTGIETHYLDVNKEIDTHIIADKDLRCAEILKSTYPNKTILNVDVMTSDFPTYECDLLVCDSVFNNAEYSNIVNLINRFDFKYLILTNTGVFHVRFDKSLSYERYWDELTSRLSNDGLYTKDVIYSFDFGMMLITKSPQKVNVEKLVKGRISTAWREYVEGVI